MLGLGLNLWNPALFAGAPEDAESMELIESATISSPVEYLDIDLPSGYAHYSMILTGFRSDIADILSAAFSDDSGESFLCDASNSDTYLNANSANTGSFSAGAADSLVQVTLQMDVGRPGVCLVEIYPGTSSHPAILQSQSFLAAGLGGRLFLRSSLNPVATVPPVLARITTLRLLPYGDGNCDPPTSEETITEGSYFLYGVPTP